MLRDGIYHVAYAADTQTPGCHDEALAIVRDGKILGSDRNGGVYSGFVDQDGSGDRDSVVLICEVPPGGELVTGFSAGPHGAIIPISGVVAADALWQQTRLMIAGQALDIELAYLGPLPDSA